MTIIFKASWNGYEQGTVHTLGSTEEARLIAAGIAAAHTATASQQLLGDAVVTRDGRMVVRDDSQGGIGQFVGGGVPLGDTNITGLSGARMGIERVRLGLGSAKILLLGESVVLGSGSTGETGYRAGGRALSMPAQLRQFLADALGPTVPVRWDSWIGMGNLNPATWALFDERFVYVNGWGNAAFNSFPGGALYSNTVGHEFTITPSGDAWNSVTVHYARSSTQGTFRLEILSGGVVVSSVDVNASNASAALGKTTLAALEAGAYTVRVTKLNSSANYICGFEFGDSTRNELQIVSCGTSGVNAVTYAAATQPWDGVQVLAAVDADAYIYEIGINDWDDATATATFATQVQSAVTALQAVGSVALMSPMPTEVSGGVPLATQRSYVAELASVATTSGIPLIDTHARVGSREAATEFYTDALHPNQYGYRVMAKDAASLIVS